MESIRDRLLSMQEEQYAEFLRKLVLTVDPESILGIRTPALRSAAKEIYREPPEIRQAFLAELPHRYFEENQLHAFLLSEIRDYADCLDHVCRFLPYVDNWATCDQLSPRVFARHREELLPMIREWIGSDHPYTCRFGLGMLMQYYLDDAFCPEYLELAASVRREDYYVRMMVAWFFATALAKQYPAASAYLEQRRLDPWVHRKAIQKALESRRISEERKEYLRTLRGSAAETGSQD